jgi:hypothetical protein
VVRFVSKVVFKLEFDIKHFLLSMHNMWYSMLNLVQFCIYFLYLTNYI